MVIGIIDFIMARLPAFIAFLHAQYVERAAHKLKTHMDGIISTTTTNDEGVVGEKIRTSITFELKSQTTNNNQPRTQGTNQGDIDVLTIAILDLVTNFKDTRSISHTNGQYVLNSNEPIQLTDDISAVLLSSSSRPTTSDSTSGDNAQIIEFFSYSLKMNDLRAYVVEVQELYRLKVMNNLGTKLYYFNEIPMAALRQVSPDGKTTTKLYNNIPPYFTYSMQEFVTNRKFTNLFGPEIDVIKKRVEFFVNNKKWYDIKGIPYTLGLLLSGPPGTGKTSIIKCLANETGRYIINVNMHGDITKSQMQNLFFNETLMVIRNGTSVNIHVPISKRIYVLEDVDCQGNIVLDRKLKAKMREHISRAAKMEAGASAIESGVNSFDEGDNVPPYNPPSFTPPSTTSSMSRMERLKMGAIPTASYTMTGGVQPSQFNTHPGAIRNEFFSSTSLQNKVAAASMETVAEGPELTMSFLLNLFDGILETPGRILVMTANEPEILDDALIRPGRMDVICKMDFCTNETICQIIEHFTDVKMSTEYRDIIMGSTPGLVTPAEVNKLLFEHMGNVDQAMDAIVRFITDRQ